MGALAPTPLTPATTLVTLYSSSALACLTSVFSSTACYTGCSRVMIYKMVKWAKVAYNLTGLATSTATLFRIVASFVVGSLSLFFCRLGDVKEAFIYAGSASFTMVVVCIVLFVCAKV